MEQKIIKLWETNKEALKEHISKTRQEEYDGELEEAWGGYKPLLQSVVRFILNAEAEKYDTEKITVVVDGDYLGTLSFVIPQESLQPNAREHVVTCIDYGSCSGCDSFQAIRESGDWDGLPTDDQVNGYMTLCLHMVQQMRYIDKEDILKAQEARDLRQLEEIENQIKNCSENGYTEVYFTNLSIENEKTLKKNGYTVEHKGTQTTISW